MVTAMRSLGHSSARAARGLVVGLAVAVGWLLAWGMVAGSSADAQSYPSRPIRLVVGFTAGGPADIPSRFIANKLSGVLGVPVVVENRPGAGAMLATQDVLSQPRDGHTLLLCTYFDPVNTLLYRKARYKVADIAPVSLVLRYDYAIAVPANSPAASIKQLIDMSRKEPGRFNFGHIGVGSTANLISKQLEKTGGLKMGGVAFKGSAEAVQEVVAGRLDLYVAPPLSVTGLSQSKQLKILAVTGEERLPALPTVPTLTEMGIPIVAFAFNGICVGQGTDKAIVDKLNGLVREIVATAEYKALLEKAGAVPISSTPAELQAVMDKALADAAPVISEFGLQMD